MLGDHRRGMGAIRGSAVPRGALAARHAGRREHGEPARPQVTDQRGERIAGVPGGISCLPQRQPLIQVGAQRLIPPLVHLPGQQLPARSWGRYGGHAADLSQDRVSRRDHASARIRSCRACLQSSGVIQNRAFHPLIPLYRVDNNLYSGKIVRYSSPGRTVVYQQPSVTPQVRNPACSTAWGRFTGPEVRAKQVMRLLLTAGAARRIQTPAPL
jgi:hypothetical protein